MNRAAISIILDATRVKLFSHLKLRHSKVILRTYTDEPIEIVGQLNVKVRYGEQVQPLVLVVVAGNGPSLFGRNWLKYIQLDWKQIATVRTKPFTEVIVSSKQAHQKMHHDKHSKSREFSSGQHVMVRDFHSSTKWIPGEIIDRSGPVSYTVQLQDGKVIRRHIDHLCAYSPEQPKPAEEQEISPPEFEFVNSPTVDDQADDELNSEVPVRRYPQRNRRPPERLMNFHT